MQRLVPLVLLVFAAGVCLPTRVARAAPAPAAPASSPLAQSLQGAAREAYLAARSLFDAGDPRTALAKYEQAYDLARDPRLLYNMAVCARSLHAYARMQGLLLRFERDMGASLSADDKADVEAALLAIRKFVGAVFLTVTPEGAEITVDGERAQTEAGGRLTLDLGKHVLVVAKEGFRPVTRALEVGDGERRETVALLPAVHLAHLTVRTDEAAAVRIDGGDVHRGGFTGPLGSGPHDVKVTAPGKRAYQARVLLQDGETQSLEVTLEAEAGHAPIWPWIVGGAAVVAGAAVGGYFLLRPEDRTTPVPEGAFVSVTTR